MNGPSDIVSPMSEIQKVTEAVFGDVPIRHGYSHQHQAAYLVAADLREAMQFKSSTAEFLKGLEKAQVRSKGSASGAPLYTGMEVIQTGGGPQRMKVVYKRGVFHLLMRSNLPAATEYRDRIFDLLEKIERDGYVVSSAATLQQLQEMPDRVKEEAKALVAARLKEQVDYKTVVRAVKEAGGEDRDYADVQNAMYMALFGTTAKSIMVTQPQVSGERYKRDCKFGKAGELRPSRYAKDYLTEKQLKKLNNGVMYVNSRLAIRFPDGRASLEDINQAIFEMSADARGLTLQRQLA